MKFTKMHGLGNDYVCINCFEEKVTDASSLARALSDRHTGIGSDGLILIGPVGEADVRLEMYNADGSRAQMCGNGIRCVAKYAVDHHLVAAAELSIATDAGIRSARCEIVDGRVRSIRVDMGRPSLVPAALPSTINADRIVNHRLNIADTDYRVTCVSMGNPHAVVFLDSLNDLALEVVGPCFERAPEFPERINVHFARVDGPTHVTVKTWERGSGATRACGTGACAVCVAGVVTERTERAITTALPGGDLFVEWSDADRVYLTGPAAEVFAGEWPS